MIPPSATFVSSRLGGTDGVAIEVKKWEWALAQLGFSIRRVAGELVGLRPDDTWLPFLAIDPPPGTRVEPDALAAAIAGSDLVVVENLCSLPLNPQATITTTEVLAVHRGRVTFHHHDLPWERPHLPTIEGMPPGRPSSLHVTISDHARGALAERGIAACTIRNSFDFGTPDGDREAGRAEIGARADDLVVLQPTRAIPRKQVGRGLAYAEQLDALVPDRAVRYWLTGATEEGFDDELTTLIQHARVHVTHQRVGRMDNAYAACDIVVFPSSWEGFGNPPVETTIARRPVAVAHYPVLEELIMLGLAPLSVDDPAAAAAWMRDPKPAMLEKSAAALRAHLDLATLPDRLATAFATVGWRDW